MRTRSFPFRPFLKLLRISLIIAFILFILHKLGNTPVDRKEPHKFYSKQSYNNSSWVLSSDYNSQQILCVKKRDINGQILQSVTFGDIWNHLEYRRMDFSRKRYETMKMDWFYAWQHFHMKHHNQNPIHNPPNCVNSKRIFMFNGGLYFMNMDGLNGGPVGDIMQWTDLLLAMLHLGIDDIQFVEEVNDDMDLNVFDHLILDATAFAEFTNYFLPKQVHRKIKMLAIYGVDPSMVSGFGGLRDMKNYWTFSPGYSPGNSFLGFVIPSYKKRSEFIPKYQKKWKALIWGKENIYFQNARNYLQYLGQTLKLELHSTVNGFFQSQYPFVNNHAVMPQDQYNEFLNEVLIFIGLGDPLMGPAPFDIISKGGTFMNYGFTPERILGGYHPTKQKWTSQFPYIEKNVSFPHAIIVYPELDYDNVKLKLEELRRVHDSRLKANFDTQVPESKWGDVIWLAETEGSIHGYVPFDYTSLAMIERICDYIIKN